MRFINSVITGFVQGLVLPGVAWVLFNVVYKGYILLGKPAIPYLIAIGLNLFLIRLSFKKGAEDTGKGIMMATFLSMIIVFLFITRLT